MTLPFLKPKKKQTAKPKPSYITGVQFGKRNVAGERIQRMLRERAVFLVRFVVVGGIIGIMAVAVLLTLASAALSLKTGEKLTFIKIIEDQVRKSPLAQFLPKDPEKKNQDVVGLPGIPEYPGSDFIFANFINRTDSNFVVDLKGYTQDDQQELYKFLSSGQSVYFIPVVNDWTDVTKYYKDELPKRGWNYVITVGIEDLDRIPGEYYEKENQGLHIYTISDDIWYELITKDQAEGGLKDRILAYKTKQLLVESAKGADVPAETWWSLRYSIDWDFSMSKHVILGEQNISFRNKKTPEYMNISALKRFKDKDSPADVDYKYLQDLGQDYVRNWLTSQPPSVSFSDFTINKTTVDSAKAVEFVSPKNKAYFIFFINSKNKIVYVMEFFADKNSDFYEYVKANLRSVKKP